MKIIIETISQISQRYPTIGDWYYDVEDGILHIKVSTMPENRLHEVLIAVHELIEAVLCLAHGIPQEAVDNFDLQYEQERMQGKHSAYDEPGDDPRAPYRKQHQFATKIEKLLAKELKANWKKYLRSL